MSSRLPHEEVEALIAADALDGLDDTDRQHLDRLLASHGPDCTECRRLEADYAEVAGRIGLLLEPEPLSSKAEDALVAAALGSRPEAPGAPRRARAVGPGRRWMAVAAVAAAVALVAGVVGYTLAPNPPGLRTVTLQGTAPGHVSLVYQPGRSSGVLLAAGLADPGGGKVYELWYQPSAGARMRPAGVFTSTDGSVPVSVGTSFVLVAVTVEPGPDGSPQPTSNPILSAAV